MVPCHRVRLENSLVCFSNHIISILYDRFSSEQHVVCNFCNLSYLSYLSFFSIIYIHTHSQGEAGDDSASL